MVTAKQTTHLKQYILSQFDAYAAGGFFLPFWGVLSSFLNRQAIYSYHRLTDQMLMKCERVRCISHAPVATNPGQALMRKLFLFNSDMAHLTFYCNGFCLHQECQKRSLTLNSHPQTRLFERVFKDTIKFFQQIPFLTTCSRYGEPQHWSIWVLLFWGFFFV